ncbi:MAG: aminoglycoside phosphotransferase family protein [Acidimicrobiales bacterium]
MEPLALPANLVAGAQRYGFEAWLASLPATVEALARRWSLSVGPPFQPGGCTAWVAPARGADGTEAVLKVRWRHREGESEADGLRFWDGDGTVTLYDHARFDDTAALLVERCTPGTALSALPEPRQDDVIAALLPRLWRAPPPGHVFGSLRSLCESWAAALEDGAQRQVEAVDPGIVRRAVELLRELPATAGDAVLLCTDLHAGNVLAARREPWLVIDPKPFVGDPAYDALQHMLNCPARLSSRPDALVARLADLLDLDAQRLRLWLFARCVWEARHTPGLLDVARVLAPR